MDHPTFSPFRWTFFLFLWAILYPSSQPVHARSWYQVLTDPIRIQGQARALGELYGVQGTDRRRPSSASRLYISPTLYYTDYVSVGIDLMLSDEGSSVRQDMNIMSLKPSWKWGRAYIGDFSLPFSRYTFQGMNVKGGGLELFPGWLRFAAGGGQSKRAVEGNVLQQSFDQSLYTGRLGIQFESSSFVDVIVLKARDDPGSRRQPDAELYEPVIVDTLETELDTLWIEPPYNPYATTPQENVLVGITGSLRFLDNRLRIDFEGSGSAFTQNLWAKALPMDSLQVWDPVTSLLESVFQPRRGSNIDYAMRTEFSFRSDDLQVRSGYGRIGPGYQSLGTPSTVNDRQEWMLDTRYRLGQNRLSVHYTRFSDNLSDQKQSTNIRNQFRLGLNRHAQSYRSSYQFNVLKMNSDAPFDSLMWDYTNLVLNTHQSLVFDSNHRIRQIGVRYTFQRSDKNLYHQSTQSRYHTLKLTTMVTLLNRLSFNGSAGLSRRQSSNQGTFTTQVYTARLNHQGFRNRLSTSFFITSSMVRDTDVFRSGVSSTFRLTQHNTLMFRVTYNVFNGTREFSEVRSSLSLSHRF
jgi:hypothetical protein